MRMIRPMFAGALASVMLSGAALAAGSDVPAQTPAATADADKIICKKTLETGSLVKKKKECFTKAEWDRIYAANREGNEKTRDQLSSGFNCQATNQC